ncbi:MAG: oligoribonuclease, partial [Candidatus Dormibacteraceae bacterium]
MLAWIDLEMTGLEVSRHTIVEIASMVTDDELAIVGEGPDVVVHQPPEVLGEMDDKVRRMHSKSGLLAAIERSTVTLEEAGAVTLSFFRSHLAEGSTPLCGNSIGTDRRFLAAQLPAVDRYLHY